MMSTVIFRTAAKLLVPLSLIFAAFIYFKGHQTPGGGFVAGLVTAVALIVQRMAEGPRSLERLLPAPERYLIAIGLILALGSFGGALFFGLPFGTSNHGYLPEGLPKFEWATVMIFDLGVLLVVAGVVVGMINSLSREME